MAVKAVNQFMPSPSLIRCYTKCEVCGVMPFMGYEKALRLTPKQQEIFAKQRNTCSKCGGVARILTMDEERRLGLDGMEGYSAAPDYIEAHLSLKYKE